jgi:hypothetical protein
VALASPSFWGFWSLRPPRPRSRHAIGRRRLTAAGYLNRWTGAGSLSLAGNGDGG